MGSFSCPRCEDEFESKTGMKIHYGHIHDGSISGVNRECQNCGETHRQHDGNHNRRERDFCSYECYHNWQEGRTGEKSNKYNKVSANCESCAKCMKVQPWRLEKYDKLFCDIACRVEWQKKGLLGEENPNFNPEYDGEYGNNWSAIREKTLKRDFYRCRSCRVKNSQHKKKMGFGLDAHHRIPIHTFSSKKKANSIHNLITLCRSCHVSIESNIDDSASAGNA